MTCRRQVILFVVCTSKPKPLASKPNSTSNPNIIMKTNITLLVALVAFFVQIAAPMTLAQQVTRSQSNKPVCEHCGKTEAEHMKRADGTLACPTGTSKADPNEKPKITDLHTCSRCGKPEDDHIKFDGKIHCRSEKVIGFVPDTLTWNDLILETDNYGKPRARIPNGFVPKEVADAQPSVTSSFKPLKPAAPQSQAASASATTPPPAAPKGAVHGKSKAAHVATGASAVK